MLQACLNGPRVTLTSDELADEAAAAVAAGAVSVHLHPKGPDGADSLAPAHVDACVRAVRTAVPGTEVGVTTGAWALPEGASSHDRLEAVRGWQVLPDVASVNWHEPGAAALAELLLHRGVGVEAGLWTPEAARDWAGWADAGRCRRALVELGELTDGGAVSDPEAAADAVLRQLPAGTPVLLHGAGASAWPVLRLAVARGLATRIGLEDADHLPDGAPLPDVHPNAALVAAARSLQP
ncbi:3-keto-5-aminohexanoate cleavage protein [Angustibacter aerolatus]